ncbi:cytochrome c oxidase assembly protein [Peribacillus frigoritolerans]|uniref:cytochrome c oxidase assembly protein n=1 Tax=Peribacillus frigoritolerans TaxID=450367 RepID=UPI0021AA97F3|nr:cytochrome c oxidase assembly protein [Peribacillus frigoritolerans]MCT4480483.1 cytochrome c oxidase assembly protein [Peribacillus frigoritolerans]
MHSNGHIHDNGAGFEPILLILLALVIVIYIAAAVISNRRYKKWPLYRTLFWILGTICAASVIIGPIANRANMDFTAHMVGHLLLGMIAPILLVFTAPITLALRTLDVQSARRLSKVLKSWPLRIISNPITASVLNIGGLWILYTTELYGLMHQNALLHALVHFHVFMAGYLFTASMIYMDPAPHRFSFMFRAVVFTISLAGHDILSKYIFAHPPSGVTKEQAENGGMLMYYAGDAIDVALIFILCYQWFKATRPKESLAL